MAANDESGHSLGHVASPKLRVCLQSIDLESQQRYLCEFSSLSYFGSSVRNIRGTQLIDGTTSSQQSMNQYSATNQLT